MQFYDSPFAPNARRVRIFMAEKGISIPTVQVDLGKLEHKDSAFTALNAKQKVPILVLDDGSVLGESVAICRYLEGLYPDHNLMGRDYREMAFIEMHQRRVEIDLMFTIAAVFRHLHPAMAEMENPQVADWGEANKPRVMREFAYWNEELGKRPYVAGDRYTIADITLLVCMTFIKPAKLTIPEGLDHLQRWATEAAARPGSVK